MLPTVSGLQRTLFKIRAQDPVHCSTVRSQRLLSVEDAHSLTSALCWQGLWASVSLAGSRDPCSTEDTCYRESTTVLNLVKQEPLSHTPNLYFTTLNIIKLYQFSNSYEGSSLVVQCLGLWASTVGGLGSIPGLGTRIPQATWRSQTNKQINK